jgi:hypothetical protein
LKVAVIGLAVGAACMLQAPKAEALQILNSSLFNNASNLVNNSTALYTNVNSTTRSNTYMKAGVLYTNTIAFQAVTLQKNWDGSAATYYLAGQMLGTNAATTNNVSFVLRTKPLATGRVSTETTNSFTYAINMNGANPVVFSVPIPALTFGGAQQIQVDSITWTAAAGAGNSVIERLEIVGGQ